MDIQYEKIIEQALAEDLGSGDITTEFLISETQHGSATIIAKAKGVVAGTEITKQVFLKVDPEIKVDILVKDGEEINHNDIIARIEGKIASILKAERVALNFLQHLSGIASDTARYVRAIEGTQAQITDTRKTTPGLRALEKHAVLVAGGKNHRMGLDDGILIKDNHLAALRRQGLNIKDIMEKARQKNIYKHPIEIEVKNLQEATEAADAGAEIIMLDNMNLNDIYQTVQQIKGHAIIEASGGITLEKVRAIAKTGIDLISIGALTHSSKALDISLKLD